MKKLKSIKAFAIGLVAGAVLMLGTSVLAAGPQVTATIFDTVSLWFDGVQKAPELPILNYQGSTYVPFKFVAEEMGGTVMWDPSRFAVMITTPEPEIIERIVEVEVEREPEPEKKPEKEPETEPEKEPEKESETEPEKEPEKEPEPEPEKKPEKKDPYDYKRIPIDYKTTEIVLTAESYVKNDDQIRVEFSLYNKGSYPVTIINKETTAIIGGVRYDMSNPNNYDMRWYNAIASGDTVRGYFTFTGSDMRKAEGMHIELTLKTDSYKNLDPEIISFDIDLTK